MIIAPNDETSDNLKILGCQFLNIRISRRGTNLLIDAKLIFKYLRIFRHLKPDCALFFTVKPAVYGGLSTRISRTPTITTITGLGSVYIERNLLTVVVNVLYRISLRHARPVVFQNLEDQDMFLNYGLVDKSSSICAPGSGVDLDRFSFASLNRNQSRKAFVFLFVGRVVGNKGIREFVGASEKVRARYPQVHCQILGWIDFGNPTAIAEQDLEEWVKRGTVEYLGSAEDVRSHIRNSDCVVLPSYREGTPRVLLEACAIGRPIIATDTPGCSRVVVDGITGLLCKARDSDDLAEKMVRMIEMSVEERVAMGLSGRQYVEEKFDEKIVIKQYIDAIDKCVPVVVS